MKKFALNIKLFFNSLFRGMKAADDIMTNSNKEMSSGGAVDEQKVEQDNLYTNLLRGEVTQEVKDLRYEMYESVRKSRDWEYLGNGIVVKKNTMFDKNPHNIDTEDGLKVIVVQDNKLYMEGRDTSVEKSSKLSKIRVEADARHTICVTHNNFVRYKIEAFTRKLVVKQTMEENKYKLDFYLSQYPVEDDPRAIYIVKELESAYNSGSRTSDLYDVKTVTFTTDSAWGDDDWKIYDFNVSEFVGIKKFDGSYVISFYAYMQNEVVDTTDGFNDDVSVEKFEKKTPRKKNTIALGDAINILDADGDKIDEDKANDILNKIRNKKN